MREAARLLGTLAFAAACERDDLAPLAPDTLDTPDLPVPPEPRCGDGLVNDDEVCLRSLAVGLPYAHEFIRYADFDGDGTRDFFAINTFAQLTAAVFFTGGLEMGGPEPLVAFAFEDYDMFRVEVLDIDGDGRSDLAAAARYWYFDGGDTQTYDLPRVVWRNTGDHQFAKAKQEKSEVNPTLAVGDIDGDGTDDLFGVGFHANGAAWAYVPASDSIEYVSYLDLTPLELTGEPLVVAADYNGDAHADFALLDGSGRAWRVIGGPGYQLTVIESQAPPVLTPDSQTLISCDLDGDGITDLAAVHIDPAGSKFPFTISLALGRTSGDFAALASFDTAYGLTWFGNEYFYDLPKQPHLGCIDLDGSGQPALVYAHEDRPELVIHPHIAHTLGTAPAIIPLDFPANSVFVDDFEGDGDDAIYVTISDIVVVEPSKENPDGRISKHYLVRYTPDP